MEEFSIIDQVIRDDFQDKPVYHYTSPEALINIFTHKKIWCTHSFYLNDLEENLNGWRIFLKILEDYNIDNSRFSEFKEKIEMHLMVYGIGDLETISYDTFKTVRLDFFDKYVFSASYLEDDLNQWRSYCSTSGGFCFGLDLKSIRDHQTEMMDLTEKGSHRDSTCRILIKKCIYNDEEKQNLFQSVLKYSFEEFIKGEAFWEFTLLNSVSTLCIYFKNKAFEAENECRIIVSPHKRIDIDFIKLQYLKFRTSKSLIIPYLELDLHQRQFLNVTIGPTPLKYHSRHSVDLLVRKNFGEVSFPIKYSNIPYRNW